MDQADLPSRTEATSRISLAENRMHVRSWPLTILATLAVFYTLYFASEIVLPFVLALVLNLLLAPAMRFMSHRLRLPKHLSALLLILLLFGFIGMIGLAISVPASGWIARAPQSLPALQHKLAFLHQPIAAVQGGLARVEGMMSSGGGHGGGGGGGGGGSGGGGGASLAGVGTTILSGTKFFLGEIFTLVLVLFFLLASGDSLLRRFVEIMPTLADKRRAVQMVNEIEHNVSLYLATITMMNTAVGLLNMLQVWLFGLPNPLLWGVVAFMLNYIPILGPMTGIVIFFFVGLFTFDSVWQALLPAAVYLAIHVMEGETITPMLLARRFTLNPLLVIASLMFWDWLWGIPGAFLSVPLLAVFKIVCDHLESLTPLGHMLGDAPAKSRRRAAAA
jgi:predicted PurR-regulated permease PerM